MPPSKLISTITSQIRDTQQAKQKERFERARQAMLQALGSEGAKLDPYLQRRIEDAKLPIDLWYARPDLVHVLCKLQGEKKSIQTIRAITPMFEKLVPVAFYRPTRKKQKQNKR